MKATIQRALFLWLALIILIQPLLSHIDYLKDVIIKSNADYITEKAAPEGMVTAALRDEVIDNLKAIGFQESQISIIYSTSVVERKQRIDATIRAPRDRMFLFHFGNAAAPTHYYGRSYTMSEYLD